MSACFTRIHLIPEKYYGFDRYLRIVHRSDSNVEIGMHFVVGIPRESGRGPCDTWLVNFDIWGGKTCIE